MGCTATARKVGQVSIIDLSGSFTLGEGGGVIRNAVKDLVDTGERNIVINLADVAHIDSAAGLGELIGSYTTVTKNGGQLKLLNARKSVNQVLRVTRLDTVFEIYSDERQAVQSFG